MNQRTKLTIWLIVGILLALGPIWGTVGTVIGMLTAFGQLQPEAPVEAEALAKSISLALYTTVAGWVACPIGIVTIIVSAVKLGKCQSQEEGE